MSYIPFDTRTVKYAEYAFKINNSPSTTNIPLAENEIEEANARPLTEPYEYFERKSSKGMGNVRIHRRPKYLPRKAELAEIVTKEKPEETKPKERPLAAPESIPVEIPKSFDPKKEKPKRKPRPPPSINNKINSIVGRSAFKPSLIITADNSQNKKRTKKDIFGIY
jgi:hypothetical protein